MNKSISGTEFLAWYCRLVLHGYSSQEAKRIVFEVMKKAKEVSQ